MLRKGLRNNDFLNSVEIVNVVTTADLKRPVQIQRFNDFSWGRFDLENNYNGRVGYVKDDDMQGRVTVFTSGKLISMGGKSVNRERIRGSSLTIFKVKRMLPNGITQMFLPMLP